MPIEALPDGEGRPRRVLTTVPRPGAVLVASVEAPAVPGHRCVDVRPGPVATFDGDRIVLPLTVRCGDVRRRFARHEIPALEEAVSSLLRRDGAAVRFGDRAACRRVLPTAAVERRLAAAARREGETLVTWTSEEPDATAPERYDVVLP